MYTDSHWVSEAVSSLVPQTWLKDSQITHKKETKLNIFCIQYSYWDNVVKQKQKPCKK